jgi:hypothetical protein
LRGHTDRRRIPEDHQFGPTGVAAHDLQRPKKDYRVLRFDNLRHDTRGLFELMTMPHANGNAPRDHPIDQRDVKF